MRKLISTLSAALLLSLCVAPAANAFMLSLVPQSSSVTLGNVAWVDVIASGLTTGAAPSIGAYDLDVTYDTSLLGVAGVVYGFGLDTIANGSLRLDDASVPGLVNVFELSFDSIATLHQNQLDTFRLFSISFNTLSAGTASFGLSINSISNAEGTGELSPDVLNGVASIEVTSPAVPLPAAGWLLAFALASLGGSRALARRHA